MHLDRTSLSLIKNVLYSVYTSRWCGGRYLKHCGSIHVRHVVCQQLKLKYSSAANGRRKNQHRTSTKSASPNLCPNSPASFSHLHNITYNKLCLTFYRLPAPTFQLDLTFDFYLMRAGTLARLSFEAVTTFFTVFTGSHNTYLDYTRYSYMQIVRNTQSFRMAHRSDSVVDIRSFTTPLLSLTTFLKRAKKFAILFFSFTLIITHLPWYNRWYVIQVLTRLSGE